MAPSRLPRPALHDPRGTPLIRAFIERRSDPGTEHAPAPPGDGQQAASARLLLAVIRLGPTLLLAILAVVFTVASPYFLTSGNLQNLGAQSSIVMALALGQLIVVLIRGIDISVGSVIGFSVVFAAVVGGTGNGWQFLLLALLGGALIGTINGAVIVWGRLPQPFIVTLATLGAAAGAAQLLTDGTAVVGVPELITTIGGGELGPVPTPVLLVGALGLLLWYVTTRTQWGRWLYALGGNPEGATRMGLPVGRITMAAFVISGVTAACAGIIAAGRTNTATPLAGTGAELDSIIAVVIGGASLFGGRGTVVNVLVGALILGTIRNGLDLLGVSPYMQQVAVGVIVLAALELDVIRRRLEERVKRLTALEVER